jgi:hypothetical protein
MSWFSQIQIFPRHHPYHCGQWAGGMTIESTHTGGTKATCLCFQVTCAPPVCVGGGGGGGGGGGSAKCQCQCVW